MPQQGAQLPVASDKPRGTGVGDRLGWKRRPRWRFQQRRDQPRRLGRGADPELRAEPRGEPLVGGHRAGLVAVGDQEPDELTGGLLVERPGRRALGRPVACRRDIPVGLGRGGERRVRGAQPVPVLVSRVEHPVRVELAEQVAAVQRDRLLGTPGRQQPFELADIDQEPVAGEFHVVPSGAQVLGRRPERRAQRPQRTAQAGPGAGVQDVGPQQGGEPESGCADRAARRARPAARRPGGWSAA